MGWHASLERERSMLYTTKTYRYTFIDGELYRRSYLHQLLCCAGSAQANYLVRELHEGMYGSYVGSWALAQKIIKWGFYWPTLVNDVAEFILKCPKCQYFSFVTRRSQHDMVAIRVTWPFVQWGVDLMEPFPMAPSGKRSRHRDRLFHKMG